jgi:HAD superfamily hydrolase (TIGR01484 family)
MRLFLFDVDGTLVVSGQSINNTMKNILEKMRTQEIEIGIVGGGKYEKIKEQLDGLEVTHLFSESGCVYHKNGVEIYRKNIRTHTLYPKINLLIKTALKFLSETDYEITGNFVDLRSGIIYISLIGMAATQDERKYFMDLDNKNNYRKKLLDQLKEKADEIGIIDGVHIVEGGSVGIAIYPREWDKEQVLDVLNPMTYSAMYYFGDKYMENGNDYRLLHNSKVHGIKVNSWEDTFTCLLNIIQ